MVFSYLLWAGIGILLGFLYTRSIQEEIRLSQKQASQANQRNPIFSIMRIAICSAVLIYGLSRSIVYELICLAFFLITKYSSLFFSLTKREKK